MPRGNGYGPMGVGPRTGRGAGFCNGYTTPGFANPGGYWVPGCGWGRGYRYYQTGMPGWAGAAFSFPGRMADEDEVLKEQEAGLEEQLRRVKERRRQLKGEE
jgi:hypothetical protein